MKKDEYALCSSHTCPKCGTVHGCALPNYPLGYPTSPAYECPNCGYKGPFDPQPSGFFEWRKRIPPEPEPLWPLNEKVRFKNWKPPTFDERGMTKWNWMCSYHENLEIGRNVDVGAFSYIQAQEGVVLEDDVQIGGGCKIYSVDTIGGTQGRVVIKRGARVGANSVILPGVVIGENAVVGALSLVKEDIPAGEVWAGVPARRIRAWLHV